MPLPKNDPYARVVDSLDELVEAHKNPVVEVAFYPKLDTPKNMLELFEAMITKDQSFNIFHSQKLDDESKCEYYMYAYHKEYLYDGTSLKEWQMVLADYLANIYGLSPDVCDQFIQWAIGELQAHLDLLKKLKRTNGKYKDLSVLASLRASQASGKIAQSDVLEYHKDRQNYTLMKYFVGPSTRYAPRSTFADIPKKVSTIGALSEYEQQRLTPCEYALDGQGVCVHKGLHMPRVKTYHRAPEGPDCQNPRGFLIAWLAWDQ